MLLVLKAFSAGCSALTGVEAIANGVPLFREPRQARAKETELLLGVLLGVMLIGLAVLVNKFHVGPRTGQTVLSQVMAYSVGRGWFYYIVSLSITVVLGLAANTSFGGLPVLASLLARDHYLPHAFALRGDRLVFSKGIWALAVAAGLLLVIVRGNTNTLIPLFAIGVFIGFTLAQTGMVVHWRSTRPPHWRRKATVNAVGAVVTARGHRGLPRLQVRRGGLGGGHRRPPPHRHVPPDPGLLRPPGRGPRHRVDSPASPDRPGAGHRPGRRGQPAHLVRDLRGAVGGGRRHRPGRDLLRRRGGGRPSSSSQWHEWDPGVRLVTLRSQYHSVARPIVRFIDAFEHRDHDYDHIIVLIPVVQPGKWYQRVFHNQLDLVLSAALRDRPELAVARLPVTVRQLE